MGLATCSVSIVCLINIWKGFHGQYSLLVNTYLVTPTACFLITHTMIKLSNAGSYWPFMLSLAYYFVLPERRALFFNILTALIFIPTAWLILEQSSAVRFSAVMLGVNLFAYFSIHQMNVLHGHLKEQALKDRLLLEAIPDPVIIYAPNREITYINQAFEGIYGWTKNELIGGTIDFVPSEEVERTKKAWHQTLNDEKIFFETKRKTKDGRVLDIQQRTAIIKDQKGNHSASIVLHRDVTIIKQSELERERLIDDLKQALAKVKTLSGFLPICSSCKKIRDDKGYWNQIESYVRDHSEAEFSHGICPECANKLYPEMKTKEQN